MPSVVSNRNLKFAHLAGLQNFLHEARQIGMNAIGRGAMQRFSDVTLSKFANRSDCGGEFLDARFGIEEERWDLRVIEKVLEIVARGVELPNFFLQLIVNRLNFLL